MKCILTLILLTALILPLPGAKVATFPGLMTPDSLRVDREHLYITEGVNIYIYSLKDFSLIKKFGSKGQGPKEFYIIPTIPLKLDVKSEHLMVSSVAKISYFSKKGEFQKELRNTMGLNLGFKPLDDKYIGVGLRQIDKKTYRTLNVYDSKLQKEREIFKQMREEQAGGRHINVMAKTFSYDCFDGKIYISGQKDFIIDVWDISGKLIKTVRRDYQLKKVTASDIEKIMNHFKIDPNLKQHYATIKRRIKFPETYPAISTLFVAEQKLIVLTHFTPENKKEAFFFGLDGTFLKRAMLPIVDRNPIDYFPFWIENGNLYQLIESEDEEEWELHVAPIE
jgi:hypothetical protein